MSPGIQQRVSRWGRTTLESFATFCTLLSIPDGISWEESKGRERGLGMKWLRLAFMLMSGKVAEDHPVEAGSGDSWSKTVAFLEPWCNEGLVACLWLPIRVILKKQQSWGASAPRSAFSWPGIRRVSSPMSLLFYHRTKGWLLSFFRSYFFLNKRIFFNWFTLVVERKCDVRPSYSL